MPHNSIYIDTCAACTSALPSSLPKMMSMAPPVDPETKMAMKAQGLATAVTALLGVALIRIAPAVLEGLGMASE